MFDQLIRVSCSDWLQVIRWLYPGPAFTSQPLAVHVEEDAFRPFGRKWLDSEVMMMLGIRARVLPIMCPSGKSPLCQQ